MTIFRVDFGSDIGLGHLMRSLVYAKEFDEVVYISKSNQKELLPYPLITIKDEEEFFLHVKKLQPKEVVVDNYAFTLKYQKEFKKLFPHVKLTCFDDEYKEYICDEIINHNLGIKKQRYKEPHKIKIISPLIRHEFRQAKKQQKKYHRKGILISLGGSDAKGLTLKLLKLLPKEKINLYITSTNKHLLKIKRFVSQYKNIKLFLNADIAIGMANSKMAIITPSTITYEALFMDLPFIAIQVAKNQDTLVQFLKQKRYITIQERELWKIRSKLLLLMHSGLKKRQSPIH